MSDTRPRGAGGGRAQQLLSKAGSVPSVAGRMDLLSRALVGCPYEPDPLEGSSDAPESFVASLRGFDCVTYVETVLALSLSSRPGEFTDWLRRIRYEGGRVEWALRNHYMTGWIRENVRIGAVRRIGTGARPISKTRRLDTVPGLPPRRVRFSCVPKSEMKRLERSLRTGDLIFFASTRTRLDVFHCGILIEEGGRWRMRHAARSRKSVVEQDLSEFLRANRMAGVLVVRPVSTNAAAGKPGVGRA